MLNLESNSSVLQLDKSIAVDVNISYFRPRVSIKLVSCIVRTVLFMEGVSGPGEVSVSLVNDAVITELNAKYLGHSRPTDVMAFPLDSESWLDNSSVLEKGKPWVLGDVVVSLETAKRQALRYNHSFYTELALLLIHGVLHLLGYSDKTNRSKMVMRRKERKILSHCEVP